MPLTQHGAQVSDPVLTPLAQDYRPDPSLYVWASLFPVARVGALEGKYVRHDKSGFVKLNLRRGKTGQIVRARQGWTDESVSLERRTIAGEVADSDAEQAAAIPGGMIDLYQRTTTLTMESRDLQIEIEAATVAQDTANYNATQVTALAGAARWDNPASDPQEVVSDAGATVRGQCGRDPNVLVLGYHVARKLLLRDDVKKALYGDMPEISDEAARRARAMAMQVKLQKLAAYFNVDRIRVGSAQYVDDPADTELQDVWGKVAILARSELSAPSTEVMHRVTWGATLRLAGYPRNLPEFRDDNHTCQVVPFETYDTPKRITKGAAWLFQTAVD